MLQSPQVTLSLSLEKLQQIASWRAEVDRSCHSQSNLFDTSPSFDFFEPMHDFHGGLFGSLEQYHQVMDDDFDMDRWTFVFEGDQRLQSLPHPARNPLVTAELELLRNEYISVLHIWNEFEVEKWRAQKMLRGAATPDNVQRVFTADHAIESASSAARYIETHAKQYGVDYNFEALFFRIYQPPGFGFYPQDEYWNDSPFTVQTSHIPQQNMMFTPCIPSWTVLPAAMPSRMVEV